MRKSLLSFLLATAFLIFVQAPVFAEVILDDDFNNVTSVNSSLTNAYVDTTNGYVRLPKQSLPNALALKQYGPGYVLACAGTIKIMDYDELTNTMITSYTVPYTDPLGVSMRQDIPRFWVASNDKVQQFDYDENSQLYAPGAAVSGLGSILSISSSRECKNFCVNGIS